MESILPYFMILAGLFSVVAAIADWDWYMNHYKARFFVKILGRNGARIFYVLLGLGLMIFSIVICYDKGLFGK